MATTSISERDVTRFKDGERIILVDKEDKIFTLVDYTNGIYVATECGQLSTYDKRWLSIISNLYTSNRNRVGRAWSPEILRRAALDYARVSETKETIANHREALLEEDDLDTSFILREEDD